MRLPVLYEIYAYTGHTYYPTSVDGDPGAIDRTKGITMHISNTATATASNYSGSYYWYITSANAHGQQSYTSGKYIRCVLP